MGCREKIIIEAVNETGRQKGRRRHNIRERKERGRIKAKQKRKLK